MRADSNNQEDSKQSARRDILLDLVIANSENIANVGWLVCEHKPRHESPKGVGTVERSTDVNGSKYRPSITEMKIPFYQTVREGANFDQADWKDQACVRQAVISWRDDLTVKWLERHAEMTQGFFCIGRNAPGLFVLGDPTHDRVDLDEEARKQPDLSRTKAYIIPPGCGIIIKKGTWHDFPVSCGPPLTTFIINTEEVVEALGSMTSPAPMDHGDCYKISLEEEFSDLQVKFPDPRDFIVAHSLVGSDCPTNNAVDHSDPAINKNMDAVLNGPKGYGLGMLRTEVDPSWGVRNGLAAVYVVPVVNVEVFLPGKGGPAIQPHLQSTPELANKGWRDYGNKRGLSRLVSVLKKLQIPATAVINSDAVLNHPDIADLLSEAQSTAGWEMAAHGTNNSTGYANIKTRTEEAQKHEECLSVLTNIFGKKPISWLTPGFSVTVNTPEILASTGIEALLDFVDDEVPYEITNEETGTKTLCIPYSMETNDFSLVLGRQLSPREYAGTIESHIEQLADEAVESGTPKVVCIGMHTFVAGSPGYARELGKVLGNLRKSENIRFATAEAIVGAVKISR